MLFDVYHHYGLTGERSVFAHGIHLHHSEWQCLHRHRIGGVLPYLHPVSWQRAVSVTCPLAAQGADGYRHRRRRGYTFSTLHAGGLQGQLQSHACAPARPFIMPRWGRACPASDDKIGNFARCKEADFT